VNTDSIRTSWTVSMLLEHPVLWLSLALFLIVLPVRPEMASGANLEILLLSMTLLLVLAIGQTFVLITAGIDLSLPAVMSLASVVGASIMAESSPLAGTPAAVPLAIAAMALLGLLIGALQGTAVAVGRMPAFLVSLASLILVGGVAVWYTHSERVPVPAGFVAIWYGRWLGIPCPVLLVGTLAIVAHAILAYTVTGRWLYAIGHSLPTSLVSGVPVVRVTVFAYMASGLCAAIASMLYTARLYTGSPQLVENEVLLDCIGAAVIGGTSLFGGKGKITGTVMGVLFMALVGNSLNMLGLRYWHVITVKGGVILLAALLDALRNRFLSGD
jgi:ribose/xylose/arabinose/galactoside ABC-type transport system permease subunit